ncbi:hypothetical protein Sste5346_006208 [Sporothrix stenoceras]|uniref:Methyltransferase domain-containing protein n=1 Tax=Sporothrix stenoceras TaxID=5173 RepID=A0ABR3YZ97_9PEZI
MGFDVSHLSRSSSAFFASIIAFLSNLLSRSPRTPDTKDQPASEVSQISPSDKNNAADAKDATAAATVTEGTGTSTPEEEPTKSLTAAEAFDSVGPAYEDAFKGLPTQAAAIDWLVDHLKENKVEKGKIVDVGCGTGRPACSVLADAGHDVLGIDISEAMLTAARERVPNARFELVDVRPFIERETAAGKQGTLDAVTVFFSLIAGVTQDDIRAVLAGLAGLLKPGGFLVFSTVPIPVNNAAIKWMGRPVVVSSLSPEEGVAAVKAAGLDVKYDAVTKFTPKGADAGICAADEVWEESHLFVYAQKPAATA